MKQAVLSFMSGKGKRIENIRSAVRCVECLSNTTVLVKSGLYELPLRENEEGLPNLSAVAVILTCFSPHALMGACKGIEAAVGRAPDDRTGIHIIDIDLILYEGAMCQDPELTLPHPDILKRESLLFPLGEVFADGKALGYDFSAALRKLDVSRAKAY